MNGRRFTLRTASPRCFLTAAALFITVALPVLISAAVIDGTVLNSTGSPAAGVHLVAVDSNHEVIGSGVTDINGGYRITPVKEGTYGLQLKELAGSYEGGETTVDLAATGLTVDWIVFTVAQAIPLVPNSLTVDEGKDRDGLISQYPLPPNDNVAYGAAANRQNSANNSRGGHPISPSQ